MFSLKKSQKEKKKVSNNYWYFSKPIECYSDSILIWINKSIMTRYVSKARWVSKLLRPKRINFTSMYGVYVYCTSLDLDDFLVPQNPTPPHEVILWLWSNASTLCQGLIYPGRFRSFLGKLNISHVCAFSLKKEWIRSATYLASLLMPSKFLWLTPCYTKWSCAILWCFTSIISVKIHGLIMLSRYFYAPLTWNLNLFC